jgi:hypothetical protein
MQFALSASIHCWMFQHPNYEPIHQGTSGHDEHALCSCPWSTERLLKQTWKSNGTREMSKHTTSWIWKTTAACKELTTRSHCPSVSLKESQKSYILAYQNLSPQKRNAMTNLKEFNNFNMLLGNRNIGSCADSESAKTFENKSKLQIQRRTHESSNLWKHRDVKARQRNWCYHEARLNSMLFDHACQLRVILNIWERNS